MAAGAVDVLGDLDLVADVRTGGLEDHHVGDASVVELDVDGEPGLDGLRAGAVERADRLDDPGDTVALHRCIEAGQPDPGGDRKDDGKAA